MIKVIGVRFKKAGKIYYFSPADLNIEKGNYVIVETARGIEFGECVVGIKEIKEEENAEVLEVIQPEVKEPKKVLAPVVAVGKAFKKAVDGGVKTINKVSDDINAASKSKDIEDQQYTCLILLFYLDALASFLGLNEEQ